MNKLVSFLILLSFSLLLVQCEKDANKGPAGLEFSCEENPVTCELTAANGDFAIALFKQMSGEEPDKNLFISPFSISTALTMTLNGANGQTFDEMHNTLKLGDLEIQEVNESYKQLLETLPGLDPLTKMKLANSVWPQIDFPVMESFLEITSEYFNSEVIPVDFKNPAVVDQVNQWVEENTDGLIKQTLDQLSPEVVMLLINTIYFKGAWQTEFDPKDTYETDFYLEGGGTSTVDMMHIQENDFPYFQNSLFQAIDLPYGDSIYSMSVFLPMPGHTVDEIVAEMSPETWDQWLGAFQPQPVELLFPKFKMEYGKLLKRTLSDMGMPVAFSANADFSKMVDGWGVKISDVLHKSFVEVNEEGTEAAAVTVVIIDYTSTGPSVPIFKADHPFVFVIRDNKTNSILFMGKVMDPEA